LYFGAEGAGVFHLVYYAPGFALPFLPNLDGFGGNLGELGRVKIPVVNGLADKLLMPVPFLFVPEDYGGLGVGRPA
jgi:hypothetical protein